MTAQRIRQARRRIRLARVVSPWNGFVAALLLSVVVTTLMVGGFSPNLPVVAALYLMPVMVIAASLVGHGMLAPKHAPARVRTTRR